MYSQLGGTFPAPLFLFLAGISFALVTEKLWRKGLPTGQIARTTILRGGGNFCIWAALSGAGICGCLGLGAEERPAAGGCAEHDWPVDDAAGDRVLAGACRGGRAAAATCFGADGAGNGFADLLADAAAVDYVASDVAALADLESYVDGVHNLGVPQPGIFPVFPWTAFAFAGLAVGFILQSEWAR